jgi:hypothetical protein
MILTEIHLVKKSLKAIYIVFVIFSWVFLAWKEVELSVVALNHSFANMACHNFRSFLVFDAASFQQNGLLQI